MAHQDSDPEQNEQQRRPQRQAEPAHQIHSGTLAASFWQDCQSAGIRSWAMTGSSQPSLLGPVQRTVLVVVALALAIGLSLVRGGLQNESPLDQLARRSLEPDVALSNGRPTVIEFYADWCQVCREMAPAMLQLEQKQANRLDVVMVNVDNPRWQDLVDRYDVNGIPQLNLFDAEGQAVGRSVGLRREDDLQQLADALVNGAPLPQLQGIGLSNVRTASAFPTAPGAGPRSHG